MHVLSPYAESFAISIIDSLDSGQMTKEEAADKIVEEWREEEISAEERNRLFNVLND